MKIKLKKMSALLVAVLMIFSSLPLSAFAGTHDGQVRVIVENTTYTTETYEGLGVEPPAWEGTLVDMWVAIDEDSTMMSCVVAALEANDYSQSGAENNYISAIADLSQFDGGSMSGWMGTLNGWFCNEGFGEFKVSNGKLKAGDEIRIMYTCEFGADLGGAWDSNDVTLKGITFSAGTLDKTFAPDVLSYTLTLDEAQTITVRPEAANKNFMVNTYVGETAYRLNDEIEVTDGTVITVKTNDGPSMNEGAGHVTYTFTVSVPAPVSSGNLSVLAFGSASAAANKGNYALSPAFDPDVYEYDLFVPDNVTALYAWAALSEAGTGNTIKCEYTSTANAAKSVTLTSAKAAGTSLAQAVAKNAGGNTLSVKVGDQTYTVNVIRKATLSALTVKNAGSAIEMSSTFAAATTEYGLVIPKNAEITAEYTATNASAAVTVNGLPLVWDADTSSFTVEVSYGTDASKTVYTVNVIANTLTGQGTENDPFLINNVEDLVMFRDLVNGGCTFGGQYVALKADVTLPAGWTPIGDLNAATKASYIDYVSTLGTNSTPFKGTFDGEGHTITVPAGELTAFGSVINATLKNFKIYGEKIPGYGVVQYWLRNNGSTVTIENVTLLAGTHTMMSGFIGGYESGTDRIIMRNCTVEAGCVIGNAGDGFWAGYERTEALPSTSYAYGPAAPLYQNDFIGSFVGAGSGEIINCKSSATVYGHNYVGGIWGFKGQSMGDCMVRECVFDGQVIANNYAGGILGSGYASPSAPNTPCATVQNCACYGTITAADYVGGIFGGEITLGQCWNNGVGYIQNNFFGGQIVSEGTNKGAVIGYFNILGNCNIISNNYYLTGCGADKGMILNAVETANAQYIPGYRIAAGDDPENFCKAVNSVNEAIAGLNAGPNSSTTWKVADGRAVCGNERHIVSIYSAVLNNNPPKTINAYDAIDNETLTVKYNDGTTAAIKVSDCRKVGWKFDTVGYRAVELRYENAQCVFLLKNTETFETPAETDPAVEAFDAIVEALGEDPSLEALVQARKAYEALSDEQKALVAGLAALEAKEAAFYAKDAVTVTFNVAPKEVNVSFFAGADADVSIPASCVTDNGIVAVKVGSTNRDYHQYAVTVPAGTYSYRGTEGETGLGGMSFTAGTEAKTILLVRTNIGPTAVNAIKSADDFTFRFSDTTGTAVAGVPYVTSGAVKYPVLLTAAGSDIKYNWGVTLREEDAPYYTVTNSSNQTLATTLYSVQNKTVTVKATTFRLTAPEGAAVEFFRQNKNYLYEELTATSAVTSRNNGDGTVTYILTDASKMTSDTFRVSMDGKVTQAGYCALDANITVTFPEKALNSQDSVLAYDDRSLTANVSETGSMSMNVGDTFRLRGYRAWEIISTQTANVMIEPDFHAVVLSGDDVVSIAPYTSAATGNGNNQFTVTALQNGTAVIALYYDAIDIVLSPTAAYTGSYGATDPANYGIYVIKVGDSASVDAGIVSTDGTWDTDLDTVFYIGENGTVELENGADSVYVTNVIGLTAGNKTAVAGENGKYSVPVKNGANIIELTKDGAVDYFVVGAKQISYTFTNNTTGESAVNSAVAAKQGDSITVDFDTLMMPVPKMSGVYNPGYLNTGKTMYGLNGFYVTSAGAQYDFNQKASVTFTVHEAGDLVLSEGRISLSVMGDTIGQHRTHITDAGLDANLNALERIGEFGILPDIAFTVDAVEGYVPAAPEVSKMISKATIFAGTSTYMNIFSFNQTSANNVKDANASYGTNQASADSISVSATAADYYTKLYFRYWFDGEEPVEVALQSGVLKVIPVNIDKTRILNMELKAVSGDGSVEKTVRYLVYPGSANLKYEHPVITSLAVKDAAGKALALDKAVNLLDTEYAIDVTGTDVITIDAGMLQKYTNATNMTQDRNDRVEITLYADGNALGEAVIASEGNSYPTGKWTAENIDITNADELKIKVTSYVEGSTASRIYTVKLNRVKTAAVDYSAQMAGAFLTAPKTGAAVTSDKAESYGYTDKQGSYGEVTVLDVLVKAHEDIFGEDFTRETANDYLAVSYGYITKIFGVETGSVSFTVNDMMPVYGDLIESDWGDYYNAYTVEEAVLKDGDSVTFFGYQDSWYMDNYAYFFENGVLADEFVIGKGDALTLQVKGYCIAFYGANYNTLEGILSSAYTEGLEDLQFAIVDMNTGALTDIEGAVTDEDGNAVLTFDAAGSYVITAYMPAEEIEDNYATPAVMTLAKVTVTEKYIVTVTSEGTGSDATVADLQGGGKYSPDAEATLIAKTVAGYSFDGWYLGEEKISGNLTVAVKVTGDADYTAKYTANAELSVKVNAEAGKYTVNGKAQSGSSYTGSAKAGTQVTVSFTGDNFCYWKNSTGNIVSTNAQYTFTLVADTEITAVVVASAEGNSAYIEFVSYFDQIVKSETWSSDETDYELPAGPSRYGYTFTGWAVNGEGDLITEVSQVLDLIDGTMSRITLKPVYVNDAAKTVTVTAVHYDPDSEETIDTVTASAKEGNGITLKADRAPEGKTFAYWADGTSEDAVILGYDEEYFIRADVEKTVYAVYKAEEVEKLPTVMITDKYAADVNGKNRVSFTATRNIPEGYTPVGYGMIRTTNADTALGNFVIGEAGVKQYDFADTARQGVYTLNVNVGTSTDTVVYARGYITVRNDATGNTETIYSEVESGSFSSLTE